MNSPQLNNNTPSSVGAAAGGAPPPSIWRPLRHPPFRGLWVAGSLFFVGNAMQNMAASWLMIELTASPFLAALVQTASFLPMFLLSLPAGVLADTINRRQLMLRIQGVYAVAALMLAALSLAGHIGPGVLLLFIFLLGVCTALQSPSWNSAVSDTVERKDLPGAITLVSMAFNGARAVGPALAGLIFASTGASAVFVLAVLTALGMSFATMRWPPRPPSQGKLPAERLWGGMLSALRYARHSPTIFAQLVRTVAYSGLGSALWALLPVIAQQRLGLGAAGYGLLMACLGSGAVAAGFFVGRLRSRLGLDTLAAGCCLLFSGAMLVGALSTWRPLVYVSFVIGGAAWMTMMSTFNAATQTSAPPWVRARAASLHTLCSLGSFALGSALWGAMSSLLSLPTALCLAAALLIASIGLARLYPLRMGADDEVTLATTHGEDVRVVAQEPEFEAGPVAVEVVYRIRTDDAGRFLEAVQRLAVPRRRDGATFWRIYRDLDDPSRYVERFIVTSWADYLRQRARATVANRELEA
ncbi:MFS transporter [Variovorax sp. Varisp85]|uniref:MFS transporter n=1 Tax=Variovorax sp. Varisp85 TaxID=3243059 RepID=UPI0039A668D8